MKRILSLLGRLYTVCLSFATSFFLFLLLAFFFLPRLGFSFETVLSGSMSPAFEKGDLIIVDRRDTVLQIGDVAAIGRDGFLLFHRIVGTENGGYRTKGDAAATEDPFVTKKEEICGRVCFSVPSGEKLILFLKSWKLIAAAVLLALLQGSELQNGGFNEKKSSQTNRKNRRKEPGYRENQTEGGEAEA